MVTLTPSALQWFSRFHNKESGEDCLVLRLRRAGCSGYTYDPVWMANPPDGAVAVPVSPDPGYQVVVPASDMVHLEGTRIDLVRQGLNHVLVWDNPKVTASCGCGESIGF